MKKVLTRKEVDLVAACKKERRRLAAEYAQLSNRSLAIKLEVSPTTISRVK